MAPIIVICTALQGQYKNSAYYRIVFAVFLKANWVTAYWLANSQGLLAKYFLPSMQNFIVLNKNLQQKVLLIFILHAIGKDASLA